MQQNWQGMQGYMGQMHDRWGMGYPWMMGHPWTMMGPGMMGSGRTSWPLPQGLTPDQYSQQMRDQMQRMQEEMNKIAQASDQDRSASCRSIGRACIKTCRRCEAWAGCGGRGNDGEPGMMRGGPTPRTEPLPDAYSAGAKLISTYCAQCHAPPQPTLHTAKEWTSVTQRMHIRMDSGWQGIKTPTEQEMKTIIAYMEKYARP